MARSAAERMASLRARQRRAGLTTLTVVVPVADAAAFAGMAKRRRDLWLRGGATRLKGLALPRQLAARGRRTVISSREIMQFRELLEIAAIGLVIERLGPSVERRLRSALQREERLDADGTSTDLQRFHTVLGELSGDPALHFLLSVALRLTDEHSSFAGRPRRERQAGVVRIRHIHRSIFDAIVARDLPLAEARMRRYLAGLKDWLD